MTEGAPRRVLLIEDDTAIREIVELALRDEGYEVLVAPEGTAALALIEQHPPDVILLDMKMPQTDGWAFAAQYAQQHAVATRAPIIVLTAAQDAAARAAEIGATDYLAKPFELEALLAMIAKYTD
jgi:DNA-binding response OmpR family regulator